MPGSFFDSLVQGIGGLGSPQNPDQSNFVFEMDDGDDDVVGYGTKEAENEEMALERKEVDQTLSSEKTLLGADWARRINRAGQDCYNVREDDPFWISADRFLGCYSGQFVSRGLGISGLADV